MNNADIYELGVLETLKNIFKYSKDESLLDECARVIPIPYFFEGARVEGIARSVCGLGERNIVFLTPEILLFEELVKARCEKKVYVCLPLGIAEETSHCIRENMPQKLNIEVISEENIYFFSPNDTAIFVCGFEDTQGRALILNKNYVLLQKFNRFLGKKVLISAGTEGGTRIPGWKTVYKEDYFNATA